MILVSDSVTQSIKSTVVENGEWRKGEGERGKREVHVMESVHECKQIY